MSKAALARYFLALGTTAFGGPAAHIAMMEEHVVRRNRWMTREEFLDLFAAANLIPGPSSTELAIFIGYRLAGWQGLLIAGLCFILPAFLIVSALAWVYVRYGALPAIAGALYGVKPVVIAVLLQALRGLAQTALKSWWLIVVAAGTLAAALLGLAIVPVLGLGALLAVAPVLTTRVRAAIVAPLWPIFLIFVKIGAILFGSGYVLLAFLEGDLVQRLHWLTERQLLDAVAVGQVTPGPVFTTATFIGYILAGPAGAIVATVAIFLPSFAYVSVSGPLLPLLRRSKVAASALDGVTVASLVLMALVSVQLGRAALVDGITVAILAVSLVLLIKLRVNSAWLMLAGALIGLVLNRPSP